MDSSSSSLPSSQSRNALERITLQMASSLDLQVVLTTITQGLVDELDGAFARIWLLGPGDLCTDCYKAADCTNRARCLHLEASAGTYTNLDGEYRRIPLGAFKIGKIAQGFGSMYTNDVRRGVYSVPRSNAGFPITKVEANICKLQKRANGATGASPVWRSPRRCSPARSATS